MTWIEVADTAVKIGLGALIGGAFGILSPFVLSRKEVIMDRRSRRLKHMEEILTKLEEYFTFIIQHAANTSYYWTCYYNNPPELADAKKDFDKDKEIYDAKQGLSVSAMTKLVLLGHTDLAKELRAISDMMHSGINQLEEQMSSEEREKCFYALRQRLSEAGERFYENFRKCYDDEPEFRNLLGTISN